nr:MAG TPA: hypothetical protein [Caudoviricetes sp.]
MLPPKKYNMINFYPQRIVHSMVHGFISDYPFSV